MRIILNGKVTETACTTLFALAESCGCVDGSRVVIVDGYQTEEDLPLRDKMSVTLIEKGVMPNRESLEAMLAARHSPGVYEKVKAARVAVAGLGGLGSAIALSLARTGVGQLHLVDFDVVEPSNLNRQQYRITHLGMEKAEALKQEIAEVNPFVQVVSETVRVHSGNAADLFRDDQIVCEAFDRPEAKAMLVNTLLEAFPDKPVVAASGMAGFESSNRITTRRVMDRFYLCGDGETAAELGQGLMAPRVGICAGHQANMVLRLILGETEV